jgi:hypothetical protein
MISLELLPDDVEVPVTIRFNDEQLYQLNADIDHELTEVSNIDELETRVKAVKEQVGKISVWGFTDIMSPDFEKILAEAKSYRDVNGTYINTSSWAVPAKGDVGVKLPETNPPVSIHDEEELWVSGIHLESRRTLLSCGIYASELPLPFTAKYPVRQLSFMISPSLTEQTTTGYLIPTVSEDINYFDAFIRYRGAEALNLQELPSGGGQ